MKMHLSPQKPGFPILALLLAVTPLVLSLPSRAENGGQGTGNGGNSVDLSRRPSLRDLVEKSNCDWYEGKEILSRLTYMPTILAATEKVDASFTEAFVSEAQQVKVCLTRGVLRQVATEDRDAVTIYEPLPGQRQAAIRLDSDIYVDQNIFKSMNAENQAFLFVHEVMHSFIGLKVERRNTKVRSMVASIHSSIKVPMTIERFALQIAQNNVVWDRKTDYQLAQPLIQLRYSDWLERRRLQNLSNKSLEDYLRLNDLDVVFGLCNDQEKSALALAIIANDLEATTAIYERSPPTSVDWFIYAVKKGASRCVGYLGRHLDPNYGINSEYPAHIASKNGDVATLEVLAGLPGVNLLLDRDGAPFIQKKDSATPEVIFFYAKRYGNRIYDYFGNKNVDPSRIERNLLRDLVDHRDLASLKKLWPLAPFYQDTKAVSNGYSGDWVSLLNEVTYRYKMDPGGYVEILKFVQSLPPTAPGAKK